MSGFRDFEQTLFSRIIGLSVVGCGIGNGIAERTIAGAGRYAQKPGR